MSQPLLVSADGSYGIYLDTVPLEDPPYFEPFSSVSEPLPLATRRAHNSAQRALLRVAAVFIFSGSIVCFYGSQKVDSLIPQSSESDKNLAEVCIDMLGILALTVSIALIVLSCKNQSLPVAPETPRSRLI